jgi:hypothetical protein
MDELPADLPAYISEPCIKTLLAGLLRLHSQRLEKTEVTICLRGAYDVYATTLLKDERMGLFLPNALRWLSWRLPPSSGVRDSARSLAPILPPMLLIFAKYSFTSGGSTFFLCPAPNLAHYRQVTSSRHSGF